MQNSILRHPPFLRYFLGQTCSHLSYQMLFVAVGWQIYDLTNSALSLGLIGLVQFLPQFMLVLVAGHYADNHDRRHIVFVCMLVQGAAAAVLAVGSITGVLSSPMTYACAFMIGVARAFQSPATQSLLPSLVDRSLLPAAITYHTGIRNFCAVAGPALGGGIYLLGGSAVYVTSTVSYVLAAALMISIALPYTAPRREPPTLASLFAGVNYLRAKPDILGAIAMDLFAVLLGGVTALLPIFARDVLHIGPEGLGLLRAAPAIGALVMTVYLIRFPVTRNSGHAMYAGVAVFGIATIVFALSQSFALSMTALVVLGAADMVSVVVRTSLIQLEAPNQMRGRVNAVNSIFINTSNQLGQFQSGVVAALVGAVPAAVIGGVGTLLVVALWIRWAPGLYNRDELTAEPEKGL